jgi:hypothetical protein
MGGRIFRLHLAKQGELLPKVELRSRESRAPDFKSAADWPYQGEIVYIDRS